MEATITITRKNRRNYAKIETNQPERVKQAIRDHDQTHRYLADYVNNDGGGKKLYKFLRWIYAKQRQFYSDLGIESKRAYGGGGTGFNTTGYQTFLQEHFDCGYNRDINKPDHLDQVADALTRRLSTILNETQGLQETDQHTYTAKAHIETHADGQTEQLQDPELLEDAIVVTNNGVRKITTQKIEDAETLEDIKNQTVEDVRDAYQTQVNAQTAALKNQLQTLKQDVEDQRNELFVEGVKFAAQHDKWEIDGNYLVYQETVRPQTVKPRNSDKILELTDKAKETFYIENIRIKIAPTINEVRSDDAYHPHAVFRNNNKVCTGSFRGAKLADGVDKVVKQLQQINPHPTPECDAEQDFMDNWDEYVIEDDENNEAQEVWTT